MGERKKSQWGEREGKSAAALMSLSKGPLSRREKKRKANLRQKFRHLNVSDHLADRRAWHRLGQAVAIRCVSANSLQAKILPF